MEAEDLRKLYDNEETLWRELLLKQIEKWFAGWNLGGVDERVRKALKSVSRHKYMPPNTLAYAYDSSAALLLNGPQLEEYFRKEIDRLGIKEGQLDKLSEQEMHLLIETLCRAEASTISQARVAAIMVQHGLPDSVENLETSSALEIGAGSGYVLALLWETGCFSKVYGVEIVDYLAEMGKNNLQNDGRSNIELIHADGIDWLEKNGEEKGPFKTILVSAAVRSEETLGKIGGYLDVCGKLVAPVVADSNTSQLEFPALGLTIPQKIDRTVLLGFTRQPNSLVSQVILPEVFFVNLK